MDSEIADSVDGTDDEAELTVLAYSLYMKEVIAILMKNEDPKFNTQNREQEIADAIKVTLEFSKDIYKVIQTYFIYLASHFILSRTLIFSSLSKWQKMFPKLTIKI